MRWRDINTWKQKAEGNSACDYAFHMAVTRYDAKTEAQLREIVAMEPHRSRYFLAYKNFFGVTDEEMFHTLKLAAELGRHHHRALRECGAGRPVAADCCWRRARPARSGMSPAVPRRLKPRAPAALRPFLEQTGAAGYVVHLSCAPACARRRGQAARREAAHRIGAAPLSARQEYAEREGVEGMKHVMSPPLRDKRNQAGAVGRACRRADRHRGHRSLPVRYGAEAARASIHADSQRHSGHRRSREPDVHLRREARRLDIHRFVDALSTRPAKLFGLFPRKGTIAVGSDADLVVYDTEYRGTISAATQHTNNDYNGFEGFAIEGRPSVVTVRGKVQVRDGVFVGEPGADACFAASRSMARKGKCSCRLMHRPRSICSRSCAR
jgi:dihydropyrimidinase